MLPTDFQRYIHLSRYARWRDDLGRRETWEETVKRYTDFWRNKFPDIAQSTFIELENAITALETMPSMRCLMTAGEALDRDNVAGFNCSYVAVDSVRVFDEIMYILLCGTGVGFSVERQYIANLPTIAEEFHDTDTTIVVADSKVGWAKAFRELISLLYQGQVPKWDVSRVRPAGSRLRTFGGRASGPEPLVDLFKFSVDLFRNAAGRKLNSLECHDLVCKIADIVVVGGVRRSALISLSNLTDERMRRAKSGEWWNDNPQRALANNSVCYTEKPDVGIFLDEWKNLYESKSGERGIFSREASQKLAARNGRRDASYEFGTNPCCVSGETQILTSRGYQAINGLVGENVSIWNGEDWADVYPYEAGVAPLYRVSLSDGSYLECTANHRWCVDGEFVQTEDLLIGSKLDKFEMPVIDAECDTEENLTNAYSQGFYSGDGNKGYNFSWVYEPKYKCIPALVGEVANTSVEGRKIWKHGPMLDKAWVPLEQSLSYRLRWLAGLLDADGTVTRDVNGNGFQVASVDHDFLNRLRLMLTTMGVRAKVVSARAAGTYAMPDGKGSLSDYKCKEIKRLLIGNMDAWNLMEMGLGTYLHRLEHNGQKPQRDARQFIRVVSVEDLGRVEMTYCFTEPKTSRGTFNGIVTGNSEIVLRSKQFCNLTEVVVRPDDTLENLKRKVRIAAILGTLQATLTNFRYLSKEWKKNTEEEALLGVSLTGIMDHPVMSNQTLFNYGSYGKEISLQEALQELQEVAIETNKEWAAKLGINQSAAITCIKPSGTVSQLVDSASGIHPRYSNYYIRTVRTDKKDPIYSFLKDQGVPVEDAIGKEGSTAVFSFPMKAPEGSVMRDDMTAIEQLELWKVYAEHYCEHKPSITVYVRENEWLEVGAWVYKHFDLLSGVSFLPHSNHVYKQAPYQEITKEEYERLVETMPKDIDWTKLSEYETSDMTTGSQELACVAGICEL